MAGQPYRNAPEPPRRPSQIVPRPPFEPSPEPPRPTVYPPVPVVYERERSPAGGGLQDKLLERRIVLATGVLDDASATELAARLMYLDGCGDQPIELRYSCRDGQLGAAIALADTIELLGVELRATATGAIGGPALLPFAVAARRIAHPHTTFLLREPEQDLRGRAADVLAEAARHARLVDDLQRRLAAATGRSVDAVAADFTARRMLTAEEARGYGLVDEIASSRRARPS